MASLNVLVTAGSRRVPLVAAFREALTQTQTADGVFVTDVNPLSPTVQLADGAFRAPFATDDGYLAEILAVCARARIGLVVPTIDDELPVLGAARERLRRQGILVAASTLVTAELCNDKFATCEHLRAHDIPAARSYLPADLPVDPSFPLFVKPRRGRGGIAAFAARTPHELAFFCGYVEDPVIQEFLDGPEYTIDLLCDLGGRAVSIVPRERVVIRAGVSDRGRTVRDQRLIDLALACARVVEFVGAVNIQCRLVDGHPVIFEINPRFSGGIPLTIAAGAHFPRMLVELALGRPVAPTIGAFQEGLWMTSFESSLFLDSARLATLLNHEPPVPE